MPRDQLIQVRRGSTAQWDAADTASVSDSSRLLAAGEPGLDTTTGVLKVGDGSRTFADLPGYLDETVLGSTMADSSAYDFVVTDVGDGYVAHGHGGRFAGADPAIVANAALASVPQRGASVLFALRGTHACSETIVVGNSTLLAGPAGRMATQIAGNGIDNVSGTTTTYAPLLVLDFSASDIDAITNATPGAAYRPHQWTVRDLSIKGGGFLGANQRAGIRARRNTGGPSGGRCGLVTLERVYIEGFYFGVDLMSAGGASSWDGGVDTAHVIDCHVHRCVVGYRGGYSDTRFLHCDAWQAVHDPLGAVTPAGFVIQGRQDVIAFCEVEPSLAAADGVRIEAGGTSPGISPNLPNSRGSVVVANTFCGPAMTNGIVVSGGMGHRVVDNSMVDALPSTSKSVWLRAGVTETEVRGNTVNTRPVDDAASSTNLVLDNHVVGAFRREVALVEESLAPYLLAVGLESIPRLNATGSSSTGSGNLRLTYCTARRTETVSSISVFSGGAAAAATPALIRLGVYAVAANGGLTLVGSTDNDPSLLATASTKYTKALTGPLQLVQGQRYAVGLLVVTGAAAPTVAGAVLLPTAEAGEAPQIGGLVSGQADLPATISAGSVPPQGHLQYLVLR